MDLTALKKEVRAKGTTLSRLRELAALDPELAKTIAKGKTAPPTLLEELARHRDPGVQLAVANQPLTPAPALEYLGGHGKFTLLKAVAGHPNTPDAVLERLSIHKQNSVREALLRRTPMAPDRVRERLARDPDPQIRVLLGAWQGQFPLTPALAEILSRDPDPLVRQTLVANSGYGRGKTWTSATWNRLLEDPDPRVRAAVVRQGECLQDEATLERFICDPASEVRLMFASGRSYPMLERRKDLLEHLIQDPEPNIRIAGYRYGSSAIWQRLLMDDHPTVRAAATHFLDFYPRDLTPDWLLKLAVDSEASVRLTLAKSRAKQFLRGEEMFEFLSRLAQDNEPGVRSALIDHNILPLTLLERLSEDPEVHVRYSATVRICNRSSAYNGPPANDIPIMAVLERLTHDPDPTLFTFGQQPLTLAEIARDRLEFVQHHRKAPL